MNNTEHVCENIVNFLISTYPLKSILPLLHVHCKNPARFDYPNTHCIALTTSFPIIHVYNIKKVILH